MLTPTVRSFIVFSTVTNMFTLIDQQEWDEIKDSSEITLIKTCTYSIDREINAAIDEMNRRLRCLN